MEIIRAIVRPIVGLGFVAMFAFVLFNYPSEAIIAALISTTCTIVGFYFGERAAKKG